MRRLMRYSMNSPEYALQYSYLDTFLDLPWNHCDNEVFDLADVERVLDRDHYGLEKVKERIVEQMAVIKLRNDMKAPILCFYGPPGLEDISPENLSPKLSAENMSGWLSEESMTSRKSAATAAPTSAQCPEES